MIQWHASSRCPIATEIVYSMAKNLLVPEGDHVANYAVCTNRSLPLLAKAHRDAA